MSFHRCDHNRSAEQEPQHLRLLTFKAQQCMAAGAEDLAKVRSHDQWCESVSVVSRREVESTDTLSNSNIFLPPQGFWGPPRACLALVDLCGNICVWVGEVKRQPCIIYSEACPIFRPNRAERKHRHQVHRPAFTLHCVVADKQ